MKKVIASLLIAAASVLPLAASAYWVVEAESPVAFGKGQSLDFDTAVRIALRECAIRTPYDQVCVVTKYYWVN